MFHVRSPSLAQIRRAPRARRRHSFNNPLASPSARRRDQIRPAQPGAGHRLLQAPAADVRVLGRTIAPPAPRDPRNSPAACSAASRAALSLKDSSTLERSSPSAPGHQPRHRIDHHQRRQLAARQHVVADRQLPIDAQLDHALIDALRSGPPPARTPAARRSSRPPPARTARPAPTR